MMKILTTLLTFTLLFAASGYADEGLREVQAELKTQGFYFGAVDGNESAETTAAIRRYQIRNALEVTGKLNTETLKTLGGNEVIAAPIPGFSPPKPVEIKPGQVAPPESLPQPAAPLSKPEAPAAQPRVTNNASKALRLRLSPKVEKVGSEEYEVFFRGTPYAKAPRQVQAETVRRAQDILVQRNFLRNAQGGVPDAFTADALFEYQTEQKLTRTGRLDQVTLATLDLLPTKQPSGAPLKPFYKTFRSGRKAGD